MHTRSLTHWAIFSAPLLILLAILWFGFSSEGDVAIYFKDHRLLHPALRSFMQVVTDWSNPLFYGVYAVMLLTAWRSGDRDRVRFILILLVCQGVVAGLAVHFLKSFIGRPRPGQGLWFDPLTTRASQHSLPSGHTTEIIGWSLPLSLRIDKIWLTVLMSLFIGLVGFSRVYLGWHHPSDVFFGWLLGSMGGLATTVIASTSIFTRKG
ncbi:phosphatase PAP2 family protein [Pseudodesulfovibrio sediminis]|uniref:Phosphatase PAP2 family protein n=1 Tax=Pseudodesulfovibrio sediminis TaxID=2810563 RepID=A0ABN6EX59_9BACT|nr:phosphatase PAP2 family protein [Pseudodesulfovibrio sediminis]BCS90127.1 phosphatase PAP2 family protein [Pseudodesulfovibrio sediminis]